MKERITAGPACCAVAVPVMTKIPVPMIAPIPRAIRLLGPRALQTVFTGFVRFVKDGLNRLGR